MAISLQQNPYAEQGSGALSQTLTLTQAMNGSNLVVVCILAGPQTLTVTGITDNSVGGSSTFIQATGARAVRSSGPGKKFFSDIWYCDNVKGGATHITVSFSAVTNATSGVGALEYTGAGTFATAGKLDNGTGNPAGTVTLTSPTDGYLFVGCIQTLTDSSYSSVTSPWTTRGSGADGGIADYANPVAGTYGPTFNLTASDSWCISEAAFTPSTATTISGSGNFLLTRAGQ